MNREWDWFGKKTTTAGIGRGDDSGDCGGGG